MNFFVQLIHAIDQTTDPGVIVDALVTYFRQANDEDKVWTISLLTVQRPSRIVSKNTLVAWARESAQLPQWLFEEAYSVVGDYVETIALILPKPQKPSDHNLSHWIEYLISLTDKTEREKKAAILYSWIVLDADARFIFNKLIIGGWRLSVSQKVMVSALGKFSGIEENLLAHRLMSDWDPATTNFQDLFFTKNPLDNVSKPYPFYLAYTLEKEPESLGQFDDWIAERLWDGIRCQVIVRDGQIFVWSRGEELITDKLPEYKALLEILPDGTVLDGEVLPFKDGKVLPFVSLKSRIGRKKSTKKMLEATPVVLVAYDLLEIKGSDIRKKPLRYRRKMLKSLLDKHQHPVLLLSPSVKVKNWEELKTELQGSRNHQCKGLMLKRKDADYKSGRHKGDWWKWKVAPLTINAVLIYAMRGLGGSAGLYAEYTFAVWNGEDLMPFAKARSGLTDAEFVEIGSFVRQNTMERFGPVHSVRPELVVELSFEGLDRSARHKSGVVLRMPVMTRWHKQKSAKEANSFNDLKALLDLYG